MGWSVERRGPRLLLPYLDPPHSSGCTSPLDGDVAVGGAGGFPFELQRARRLPPPLSAASSPSSASARPTAAAGIPHRDDARASSTTRASGASRSRRSGRRRRGFNGRFGYGLALSFCDISDLAPASGPRSRAPAVRAARGDPVRLEGGGARALPADLGPRAGRAGGHVTRWPVWWGVAASTTCPSAAAARRPGVVIELDGRTRGVRDLPARASARGAELRDGASRSPRPSVSPRARGPRSGATSSRSTGSPASRLPAAARPSALPAGSRAAPADDSPSPRRLWLRLVDVGAALSARASAEGRSCSRSRPALPVEPGPLAGRGGPPERTTAEPDLRLGRSELGAVYLGGVTWAQLGARPAARKRRPAAVARADALFRTERQPWCPEIF